MDKKTLENRKALAAVICWAILMAGAWLAFGKIGLGVCIILFAIMMMAALAKIEGK